MRGFLTPEQMYDQEGRLRGTYKHYQSADIYFITVYLFNPSKTRVSLNGDINCEVLVGDPDGKTYQHISVSPLSEIWYSMPFIKASFKTREEFLYSVLLNQYLPRLGVKRTISKAIKHLIRKEIITTSLWCKLLVAIYSTEIKVRHDTRYEINIFDPLAESMTDDKKAKRAKKTNPDLYALNVADWDMGKKKILIVPCYPVQTQLKTVG